MLVNSVELLKFWHLKFSKTNQMNAHSPIRQLQVQQLLKKFNANTPLSALTKDQIDIFYEIAQTVDLRPSVPLDPALRNTLQEILQSCAEKLVENKTNTTNFVSSAKFIPSTDFSTPFGSSTDFGKSTKYAQSTDFGKSTNFTSSPNFTAPAITSSGFTSASFPQSSFVPSNFENKISFCNPTNSNGYQSNKNMSSFANHIPSSVSHSEIVYMDTD